MFTGVVCWLTETLLADEHSEFGRAAIKFQFQFELIIDCYTVVTELVLSLFNGFKAFYKRFNSHVDSSFFFFIHF